ncbi:hypothetical protein B0O99DRAFT_634276 [Bisporella sp. PMI_857]|nr:hypothetical protein B0O99DRAFT_634276 [Bisporella sp. PMI_857]
MQRVPNRVVDSSCHQLLYVLLAGSATVTSTVPLSLPFVSQDAHNSAPRFLGRGRSCGLDTHRCREEKLPQPSHRQINKC